jgi:hypothetical protein
MTEEEATEPAVAARDRCVLQGRPTVGRRFLLVARVGRRSLHDAWLTPAATRDFDVLLSAYAESVEPPTAPGVLFEYRPGSKVAGYAGLLREHAEVVGAYDYVALFDDDILADAATLSRMFALAAQHELKICQPALTHRSYFTFAAVLRHRGLRLRYVNFVEMMCPVFAIETLRARQPLFELGYESGIDLVWCNLGTPGPRDFAILDAAAVEHTRPVGAEMAANGFTDGRRYRDDFMAVLGRFGLPWLSCVPFAAVRPDGAVVTSRWLFVLTALELVAAVPRRPRLWRKRARNVAVYWKHLLSRRPRNIALGEPRELEAISP